MINEKIIYLIFKIYILKIKKNKIAFKLKNYHFNQPSVVVLTVVFVDPSAIVCTFVTVVTFFPFVVLI